MTIIAERISVAPYIERISEHGLISSSGAFYVPEFSLGAVN